MCRSPRTSNDNVARACLLALAVAMPVTPVRADDALSIRPGERVVFLGDSITYAGHCVAQIDAVLKEARPDASFDLLNVGLPSETASGLSEPGHPFPRPDVHERLDRVLEEMKPDVVVACYGMNDGIYYPAGDERFAAYKQGIGRLIDNAKAAGARVVLLTPPPFDPVPLKQKGNLRSADEKEFGYQGMYEGYDDVLAGYARWILDQKDRVDLVVDTRTPLVARLAEERKTNPAFTMAGDGVHLNEQGHWIIAKAVLEAWGINEPAPPDAKMYALAQQRMSILRDAWLSETGHKRPGMKKGLPLDEATKRAESFSSRMAEQSRPE